MRSRIFSLNNLMLVCATVFWTLCSQSASFDEVKTRREQISNYEEQLAYLLSQQQYLTNWTTQEQGHFHFLLGYAYGETQQFEQSDIALNTAITLLESIEVSKPLVDAYLERSYYEYVQTNNPEEYCPDREVALSYARKLNDPLYLLKSISRAAFCQRQRNDLSGGLRLLNEGVEIAREFQISGGELAMIYNATAALYQTNKLSEQALSFLNKAHDEWLSVGDMDDVFNMKFGMASEAAYLRDIPLAQSIVAEMYVMAKDYQDSRPDYLFFARFIDARITLAEQAYSDALVKIDNALVLADQTSEKGFVTMLRIIKSHVLARLGRTDEAKALLSQVDRIFGHSSASAFSTRVLQDALDIDDPRTLALVFKAQDFYEDEIRNMGRQQTTILNANYLDKLALHENELLQRELEISDLTIARQHVTEQKNQLVIVLTATVMVFLLTIIYVMYRDSKRLRMAAQTDFLTKIPNRRYIYSQAQKMLTKSGRLGVIIFDIDHFKKINDTYGHDVGDEFLIRISQTISQMLSTDYAIGRIGGEEFVVTTDQGNVDSLSQTAEQIRHSVEQLIFTLQGTTLQCTISLGVHFEEKPQSVNECIQIADKALYTAKSNGRNRFSVA